MKFALVLASFIVLTNALDQEFKDKFMQKLQEIGGKCVEEVHASDDDVGQLLSRQLPTTHEGKCMIFCMHKGFNLITEDGDFDKEGSLETIRPLKEADADLYEKTLKILEKCISSTEKDSDPCITATNYAICGINEGKALGLSDDVFI